MLQYRRPRISAGGRLYFGVAAALFGFCCFVFGFGLYFTTALLLLSLAVYFSFEELPFRPAIRPIWQAVGKGNGK